MGLTALISFDPDFAAPSDWAVMYRAAGLQVVPANMPRLGKDWKFPALTKWKSFQDELVPEVTFDGWYGAGGEFSRHQNMGLLSGRASGNTFVIDLDEYKDVGALQWWRGVMAEHNNDMELETCQQVTGGGGRQLFFRAPIEWRAPTNKTPIGVDIRGQGGFAILPPSQHLSGKPYAWKDGYAPWECEIADAPDWLLQEVAELVERYGGDQNRHQSTGPVVSTSSPQEDFDAFGNRTDGRDHYMRDLIWAAVVNWRRECPIPPNDAESAARMKEVYAVYERKTKSRLPAGTASNSDLLEREGRGVTLFVEKWRRAIGKWSTDIAEACQRPLEKDEWREATLPEALHDSAYGSQDPGALFEFLDVTQIKNTPDPEWLVSGLVIEQALGFIFGPPGCLKTFIALGMGLSFAVGMPDWWGRKIDRQGAVVYISSEGQADLKFRIMAWEQKNKVLSDDSPFYLIRQTINFMKPEDIGKLLATVKAISEKSKTGIAAVFVDTVSRVLPGADENLQKDMTLFVAACDAVRQKFNTSVIGVHHTSRNGNMRGSTVFPGAGDFLVEVNREEGAKKGSIKAAKIKAAEDGWEQPFVVEEIPCGDIGAHKSLVVDAISDASEAPKTTPFGWPDTEVCKQITAAISEQWRAGKPWCFAHNSSRSAVANISKRWRLKRNLVTDMLSTWTANQVIEEAERDTKNHVKGYRVINEIS